MKPKNEDWVVSALLLHGGASAAEPEKIGQVGALSGPSAQSGGDITHDLGPAVDEITAAGGVLGGRKITRIQRDDEWNPPQGVIGTGDLIFKKNVAAFFSRIDLVLSPAAVPLADKSTVRFLGVRAAAAIVRNGANPLDRHLGPGLSRPGMGKI